MAMGRQSGEPIRVVGNVLQSAVHTWCRSRAAVVFGFGLLHSLGFAAVLSELSLLTAHFGWALLRFDLRLEQGRLAVLALGRMPAWRRPPARWRWCGCSSAAWWA